MTADEEVARGFLKRAESGDGLFAIAYALMQVSATQGQLRQDLCFGKNYGDGHLYPGCLEKIGIELGDIAKAVTSASESYTDR